jgi:hypothetical protein
MCFGCMYNHLNLEFSFAWPQSTFVELPVLCTLIIPAF